MARALAHGPRRATAALLALITVAAPGCAGRDAVDPQARAGEPSHGGQVIVAWHQEPAVLNMRLAAGGMAVTAVVNDPMWDQLVELDARGRYVPTLASEVPTAANGGARLVGRGMVIEFGLRPEAHWSDGEPITCRDVAFTWRTNIDDRWMIGSRTNWDNVSAVECPDPHRVVMRLRRPDASYLNNLMSMMPLPEHDVAGHDFNRYLNDRVPVSSGPFRFRRWQRGVYLELERDPHYWNAGSTGKPYLDRIVFKFLKDANTLKIQLRSGEVDLIAPPFDTNAVAELSEVADARLHVAPATQWEQVGLNTDRPPLDDVRVRRAIAHAIDRAQIRDAVLRGAATPVDSFLIPAQRRYYVPAWDRYGHDDSEVSRLLAAAGFERTGRYWTRRGSPLTLHLVTTAGNPLRYRVAQILQQQLAASGIRLELQFVPPELMFAKVLRNGSYDMAEWAWGIGMDPGMNELFECALVPRAPSWEGSNFYRYCDPSVDALWHRQGRQLDPAARAVTIRAIQRAMAADVPFIPLYQPPETIAHDRRLHGVVQNPVAGVTWNTQGWWVDR